MTEALYLLKPHERVLVGSDTAEGVSVEVTMIQDMRTGKLRLVDVDVEEAEDTPK